MTEAAELAWELGYEIGYQHALILAAERRDEVYALWRPIVRRPYEEQVTQRLAEMEAAFRRTWPDRTPYRGGPVDWETGEPA